MKREKQFKIVRLDSDGGHRPRFYVYHRTLLWGYPLWWSNMWFFSSGFTDYCLTADCMGFAQAIVASLRKDWALKTAKWKKTEFFV
jgi:hypothetical protein